MKVFAGKEAGVRVGRAMIGITVLGLVAACSPSAEETPTPSPPTSMTATPTTERPSPTPDPTTESPTPTPTPSETLDADQIAARDVVNEFFRLMNDLAKDPELPLQPLMDVTTGRTQEIFVSDIAAMRSDGVVQVGDIVWEMTGTSEAFERQGQKFVALQACTDNSASDTVVAATGEPVPSDQQVVFMQWSLETVYEGVSWRVADVTNAIAESCSQS